ncbi:YaaC family protein [Rhodopseudomonas sp. HC1]|nr:YaaC family protein [Rhodopseudomonas infernalis]
MAISSLRSIPKSDASHQVMRGLRSLTDISYVTELLCARHSLTLDQKRNARAQAESIRSCLEQGLEYREAALKSDYARPTLAYYSTMSFAICEILLKRDGNYRLQRLRQQHGHHGIDFSIPDVRQHESLSADQLIAIPRQSGTFPVWYGTSNHRPIWRKKTFRKRGTTRAGITLLLAAPPETPKPLPRTSLLDLANACPALISEKNELGLDIRLVRSTIECIVDEDSGYTTWSLIIHPARPEVVEAIHEQCRLGLRCLDLVQAQPFDQGGGFYISVPNDCDYLAFAIPGGYSGDGEILLLDLRENDLNEFGMYYLASYISGMFARYYPELWEKCSDSRNKLYLLIDAMMNAAIERAPLLLLEEFREEAFVLV